MDTDPKALYATGDRRKPCIRKFGGGAADKFADVFIDAGA